MMHATMFKTNPLHHRHGAIDFAGDAVQCFRQGTTVACTGLVVAPLPPDQRNEIHEAPASSQSNSTLVEHEPCALSC